MTAMHHDLTRLEDLLADRATQGLPAAESIELTALLDRHPDIDGDALDRVAAMVAIGLVTPFEPAPAPLRARLERSLLEWRAGEPRSAPSRRRISVPWPWLAAAACLALAAVAWWPSGPPDAAATYAQLSAAPGVTRVAWQDLGERGVSGDVVWDNTAQRGVMRFTGLGANDPTVMQYQLWIFDGARKSLGHPAVDGGVFDVSRVGDDVYVHVAAKLEVFEPYLFAVTTEPPGGVVKHEDHPGSAIILVAPVDPDRG